jgi:serine/threonine protein kinase
MCLPNNNSDTLNQIKKCSSLYKVNNGNKSLIIMNDGGSDIDKYCNKLSSMVKSDVATYKVKSLFVEFMTVIKGVKLFLSKDVVHHDLKPQNLMYDDKKDIIQFIDFGLMENIPKLINDYKNDAGWFETHWSYPPETAVYNKSYYLSKKLNLDIESMEDLLSGKNTITNLTLKKRIADIYSLHNYIGSMYLTSTIFIDYIDFMKNEVLINKLPYEKFIKLSYDTFDIYGIGITLSYILYKTRKHLSNDEFMNWKNLFYKMIHPNLLKRIKIDDLIKEYQAILLRYNYIKETGKITDNYITPIKEQVINIVNPNITVPSIKLSKEKLNKIINQPSPKLVKNNQCPEGKEMNPFTKRCNNICKPGFVRDEKFKCVKKKISIKPEKSPLIKHSKTLKKECPEGKEMNPFTKRCNNICKPGFVRDEKFKCVRNNVTRKNK